RRARCLRGAWSRFRGPRPRPNLLRLAHRGRRASRRRHGRAGRDGLDRLRLMGPLDLQEPLDQLARPPTRFEHDLSFPPAESIRVYDDTLRDGEQMPGVAFSPAVKYELARALSEIGVHIMDVGFPAVSASERETLRLVLEGRRRRELRPELEVLCMMRSNPADIDATMRMVD